VCFALCEFTVLMITTNQKVRGTSHGTVEEDDSSIVTGNQKWSGDLVLINSKFVSDVISWDTSPYAVFSILPEE